MLAGNEASGAISPGTGESVLTGTAPLTTEGDLATQMVDGIHRFLLNRTAEAAQQRAGLWHGATTARRRPIASR